MASETKHTDQTVTVPTLPSTPILPAHKLQNLNGRLACYIKRMRDLEAKNSHFGDEVSTIDETKGRSPINKSVSVDGCKGLDKINTKQLLEDYVTLKLCLEKKSNELNAARQSDQGYIDLQAKYNSLMANNKKLEIENFKLKAQLNDLHKNSGVETLARVNAENPVQLSDENVRLISKIDQRLSEQYEAKLQNSLHKLRHQYEDQMRAHQTEANRASESTTVAIDQICATRNQISLLSNEIVELQNQVFTYLTQIRDLENVLSNQTSFTEDANNIRRLREEMAQQLQEYRDFMDIKMSLKLKIPTAKLLAGEKNRVNTSNQSSHFSQSSQRTARIAPTSRGIVSRQRKRPLLHESSETLASGQVEMRDSSPAPKYVKLENNGRIGVAELAGKTSNNSQRISDLEDLIKNQIHVRAESKNKIRRLHTQMLQQLQEYQVLMDLKMSLDLEIGFYGQLLADEKERLNIPNISNQLNKKISQSLKRSGRATSIARGTLARIVKHKSTAHYESDDTTISDFFLLSQGDIEIRESCPLGKYVKLFNKGDGVVGVGDWQLIRTLGENKTVFKFHHAVKIGPKECITVWSAEASTVHQPPAQIVMKEKWLPGKLSKTQLINANGELMATYERTRTLPTLATLATRPTEDLMHLQGEPLNSGKCVIM